MDSPTDFYVQVSDPRTGEPDLVNAKTVKEGLVGPSTPQWHCRGYTKKRFR